MIMGSWIIFCDFLSCAYTDGENELQQLVCSEGNLSLYFPSGIVSFGTSPLPMVRIKMAFAGKKLDQYFSGKLMLLVNNAKELSL